MGTVSGTSKYRTEEQALKRAALQPPMHGAIAFVTAEKEVVFGAITDDFDGTDMLPGSRLTLESTDQDIVISYDGQATSAIAIAMTAAKMPYTIPYAVSGFRIKRGSADGTLYFTVNALDNTVTGTKT